MSKKPVRKLLRKIKLDEFFEKTGGIRALIGFHQRFKKKAVEEKEPEMKIFRKNRNAVAPGSVEQNTTTSDSSSDELLRNHVGRVGFSSWLFILFWWVCRTPVLSVWKL